MRWWVPVGALCAFVAGHVAHEFTHAAAVVATGNRIERLEMEAVVFEADAGEDLIQASPVLLWVPVAVAIALIGRPEGWGHLYAAAFLLGYMPRSESDWRGVRGLIQ